MENQFLFVLYSHCMESVVCPRDDKIRQVQKLWEQLDDKFTKTMGPRFVRQYQEAQFQANAWQEEEAFRAGLRFGVNLMLAVLPYSSNSSRES